MAVKKKRKPKPPPKKASPKKKRRVPSKALSPRQKKVGTRQVLKSMDEILIESRRQARIDYITDMDGRTIEAHYRRTDRDWSETVTLESFYVWSSTDDWVMARRQFWEAFEVKYLDKHSDSLVQFRIRQTDRVIKSLEHLSEFLDPIVDPDTNKVKRDDFGKPVFALEMPAMDRFMKMYVEAVNVARSWSGDTLAQAGAGERSPASSKGLAMDESTSMGQRLARIAARAALLAQNPGLSDDAAVQQIVDAEAEEVEDDDGI